MDVVEAAREALGFSNHSSSAARLEALAELVPGLVAEVERLRWQVRHGGDCVCDGCWPEES